jgi:lysophospholipase L1-like esterase
MVSIGSAMKSVFAVILSCALVLPLPAQAQVTRYLLVGDSWAEEQWLDESHARVLAKRGLGEIGVSGELTTTSGSTAADWVTPENLLRIDAALARYPHLDTVQLTVGGNDFLDQWNTSLAPSQFDAVIAQLVQDVQIISEYILAQRADMEVLLSLYDYPNFEDTRDGLIWLFACNGLWNDLGQPDPEQVNTAAVRVIDAIEDFGNGNPRISHVRHLGEAQNAFGATLLPPPGDITQPSPPQAMRQRFVGGGLDCFHFNAAAYDVLVDNLVDGYIDQRFAPGLSLTIGNAQVEYNGEAQAIAVSTAPAGQSLIITYDGQAQPPTSVGSYAVVVTAPGWREMLTTTFEILPGSQAIEFDPPPVLRADDAPVSLTASASSGLPVSIELVSGPASLDASVLTLNGQPGIVEVRATQPGNDNWQPAEPASRSIEILEVFDPLFHDRFEPASGPAQLSSSSQRR